MKAEQVIHDAAVGITCSVCHKILLDPVTLPCLDSFCLKCLEPYLLNPTPACPRCQTTFFIPQEGLRAMPYNKFTEKVVMLHRICNHDADDKFCDICGPNSFSNQTTAVNLNYAEKYCLECQQKFCSNCLAYHTRMKCTSFHEVVELGIESSRCVELAQKEKDQFCPIHSAERVQVQCGTCDVLVCGLCHEQNHLTHDCRWFKEDIKGLTKQEIDMKKQMLQNSLRDRQNTIGQLQNELSIRETEIFKIRESVTRKVLQLKEALDNSEQELRQDLDNYYTVNVSSLQAEVKEKKKVLSSMMKLERFMQELTDKGSDCDLVQFNATLCQRSDTLLSASFTNLYIDELRLSFRSSCINTEVNNLIGELIRTEALSVRESAEISDVAMPKITSGDVKEFETQTETDKNSEQRSPSPIVGAPGCSKDDQMFDFAKFLTSLTVRHVMPEAGARVTGITVLGSELFVVRNTSQVYVYKSDDFTLMRKLTITGSKKLEGLVSCSHYNCLYICDWSRKTNVYRHDVTNNVTTNWSVNGTCYRLSVTKRYNILATLYDIKRIKEYTTHGSLIREISLDGSMDRPWHSVQLSTGNYAVCHGPQHDVRLKPQHRVCIVDQSGRIIQSYGGSRGSGVGQLNFPCHLAADIHDNVLVVDRDNNRVQLLSPTLSYLGNIVIPRHALKHPDTLYFNELNHLLYIGEYTGGRMFVLDKI